MKKRLLALILSALLLTNAVACNTVSAPENGDETLENTDTEAQTEAESEKNTEGATEDNADTEVTRYHYSLACNGVFRNSPVKYEINQNQDLVLYIETWDEAFVIPHREDMRFIRETVDDGSVVLLEDHGALIFRDFNLDPTPTKVICFNKGNPQVTIEDFPFPLNEALGFKYWSFIDEQTGYLFYFRTTNMSLTLYGMLKTTDGGHTWEEQCLEKVPSVSWKEDIICAKMLDENIGFISGRHYADDGFSHKTYTTTDGGETWNPIILPPNDYYTWGDSSSQSTYIASGEAYDLIYKDGVYILCLRAKRKNNFEYFQYSSTDLVTWSVVES